jgi:hypothetical protein
MWAALQSGRTVLLKRVARSNWFVLSAFIGLLVAGGLGTGLDHEIFPAFNP